MRRLKIDDQKFAEYENCFKMRQLFVKKCVEMSFAQ